MRSGDDSNKSRRIIKIVGIVTGSGALLVGLALFLLWKRRKSERAQVLNITPRRGNSKLV